MRRNFVHNRSSDRRREYGVHNYRAGRYPGPPSGRVTRTKSRLKIVTFCEFWKSCLNARKYVAE
jgi:hypothetical protein